VKYSTGILGWKSTENLIKVSSQDSSCDIVLAVIIAGDILETLVSVLAE